MSVQTEFIPLLRDCINTFNSFEFEAKQVEFHTIESHWRAMICQISVIELGTKLQMELTVSRQDLYLELLNPFQGIESSASHIPVFVNPIESGYLNNDHDNFSEKGANSLLRAIMDVVNVFKLTSLFPNTILAYYSIAFEKAKKVNQAVEFAQLSPVSDEGLEASKFLSDKIKGNYGFTTYYPQNMLVSFQNIITNHSNIFKPELN
jgi:hypothetical protein